MVMRSNAKNMHRRSTVPASRGRPSRGVPARATPRAGRACRARATRQLYAPSARKPMIARHATNAGGSMPAS